MFSWEGFFPLPSLTVFFPKLPTPKLRENAASGMSVTFPAAEVLVLHVAVVQLVALQEVVVLRDREAVSQRSPEGAGQGPRWGVQASPQLVGSCGQHWVFI